MFASKDIKELNDLAKGDEDLISMKDIIEDYNSDPNLLGVYDIEEDRQMLINGLKDEYFEKGTENGIEQGKKYNVPISVDTVRRRYSIKQTLKEGIKF